MHNLDIDEYLSNISNDYAFQHNRTLTICLGTKVSKAWVKK